MKYKPTIEVRQKRKPSVHLHTDFAFTLLCGLIYSMSVLLFFSSSSTPSSFLFFFFFYFFFSLVHLGQ